MNRRVVGLLASVALAAVGTLVLVVYVRSAEARALEGERLVDVLVVAEPIEAGTRAADVTDAVVRQEVPAKVRAEGAVDDLDQLEGLVAAIDLLPGEQLVRDRFVAPNVAQRGPVPPGLLEVTLSLDAARALGGRLITGDTVGVVGSFEGVEGAAVTSFILHKVLVTAVQLDVNSADSVEDEDEETVFPNGNLLVTLAVDAPSAERLVFTAEHGTVWLTSEPTDAPESGTEVQTFGTVMS